VFFGAEETVGSNPDHHHFGSRYRVSRMTAAERDVVVGMISVDMIGYGPQLHSRTMGRGPRTLSDALLAYAKSTGVRMTYLRDPGATGWSDHEPYELAGMPVAWIEWRNDPAYHTAGDTADRIQADRVATVGETVLGFVRRGAR
jgi:aminopeptidase YwaD